MKTTLILRTVMMLGVGGLVAGGTAAARADGQPAPAQSASTMKEKSCTGTVIAVDNGEHTLKISEYLIHRGFVLGDKCAIRIGDNQSAPLSDLRPGQRVEISYKDASGVLVADHIIQQPMRFMGEVQSVDPATHTLMVQQYGGLRTFTLADDCNVMLSGDRKGSLNDVKPGNRVMVVYEMPGNQLMAREIDQRSEEFTGTLDAIDLQNRTVKAKQYLGDRKFNLAGDCKIMVNGMSDAQMNDLRLGQRYEFSYETVNGVNVVNRIALSTAPEETTVTQHQTTPPVVYPGY